MWYVRFRRSIYNYMYVRQTKYISRLSSQLTNKQKPEIYRFVCWLLLAFYVRIVYFVCVLWLLIWITFSSIRTGFDRWYGGDVVDRLFKLDGIYDDNHRFHMMRCVFGELLYERVSSRYVPKCLRIVSIKLSYFLWWL